MATIHLTKGGFENRIAKIDEMAQGWRFLGERPALIDFYASWCGPCQRLSPIIDELAAEYDGKVLIGKCDVEEGDDVAASFMIRNVPTIVFLKDGKQVDKHVGAATKEQLKAKIDALL